MEYASLIEWYYKYPNEKWGNVNRGGDYMSRAIPDYDRKKGKLHNFETITDIFTSWLHVDNWQKKWAEILLFDAIIGNTDRHQENWAIYSYVIIRVLTLNDDMGYQPSWSFFASHEDVLHTTKKKDHNEPYMS